MKHHSSAISKRIRRVRSKIFGIAARPRLSIDRSSKHLFVQLIDDANHKTIFGISTKKITEGKTKSEKAINLGKTLAEQAAKIGVKAAILDRGPYRYAGRIKVLADSARKAGLQI